MQLISFNLDDIPVGFATVVGLAAIKFGGMYYLEKYGLKNYVLRGRVARIFIYPLKSCRGIEIDEAIVTPDGLQYNDVKDRSWMIISDDGVLVSQRSMENIALIRQTIEGDKLVLNAPGMEKLELDIKPKVEQEKIREASIFNHPVPVLHCGEEAHRWICQFLERDNLHIVHLPAEMDSISLPQFNKTDNFYARSGDVKKLHDTGPYLFLGQSSIDDLASRIPDEEINLFRFRPNILIDDSPPYDEDEWEQVQVGDSNYFTRISMCSRCIFTTVNPDQPNKAKDSLEPLTTLRKYRLAPPEKGHGRAPIFGVYMSPDNAGGVIRVNDDLLAVKKHY